MARFDDAYRSFAYVEDDALEETATTAPEQPQKDAASPDEKLWTAVREDIIGRLSSFTSPFGERPLVYCDWTASGRPLRSIETYLVDEVMPLYGNTHTASTITGLQSTCFRSEARQIVAEACNARVTGRAAEDVVLFAGSGATAAIDKLMRILAATVDLRNATVLVGPHEHHSNILPWRESGANVLAVGEAPGGQIDLSDLEMKLTRAAKGAESGGKNLLVGAFAAASNVTGALASVDEVTALLHSYGALAVWDYAAAAPYVKVDMNPFVLGDNQTLVYKDAVFFSGHKFLGGPGSPGVLVLKKRLLSNAVPTAPGGGTVFFVTPTDHRFLRNREEREEGGTPDILGAIRLGLAVQLKQRVGANASAAAARELADLGLKSLGKCRNLVLLGRDHVRRLPVFSFVVRHGAGGRYLHYNFVAALLNDLFGVQARGGCQCAGPFGMALLGLKWPEVRALESALLRKNELLRPGWVRLSLTPYNSAAEVDFILRAVTFVAEKGALFLPLYRADPRTGQWKHATRLTRFPERKWLGGFQYNLPGRAGGGGSGSGGAARFGQQSAAAGAAAAGAALSEEESERHNAHVKEQDLFARLLAEAEALAAAAAAAAGSSSGGSSGGGGGGNNVPLREEVLDEGAERLRWFVFPWESLEEANEPLQFVSEPVIDPERYYGSRGLGLETARAEGVTEAAALVEELTSKEQPEGAVPMVKTAAGDANFSQQVEKERGSDSEGSTDSTSTHSGGAAEPEIEISAASSGFAGGKKGRQGKVRARQLEPDDSHKYPLRQGSGRRLFVNGESTTEAEFRTFVPTSAGAAAAAVATEARTSSALQNGADARISHANHQKDEPSLGSNPETAILPGGTERCYVRPQLKKPPRALLRPAAQAIRDWGMIEHGDRLLLGLSGGKDSLSLLHVLLWLQKIAPVRFEIACATVDPMTPSYDPSPLIPYVESLGLKMHMLSEPIVQRASEGALQGDSFCAFCARAKRGMLYTCCRNNKYNKLVLGQHLDDLAESFLMSALHNGQVRTMKAHYPAEVGGLSIIRPLAYVRESATKAFARETRLPVINENCPACFEQPKERRRVKKLLAREEALFPSVFPNMKVALLPLMANETYYQFRDTRAAVAARGKDKTDANREIAGKWRGKKNGRNSESCDASAACAGATGEAITEASRGERAREGFDKHGEASSHGIDSEWGQQAQAPRCEGGLCFEIA